MELMIVDEAGVPPVTVGTARFKRATATVREIIRARAELHWEAARAAAFGTAAPTGERGFGALFSNIHRGEEIVAAAEAGFLAGRYFLLLDDRQADALDEEVDLASTTSATFLLITPLKGG